MNRRRTRRALLAVVALSSTLGFPASARMEVGVAHASEPAVDPCMGDIAKLCPEARRGHGGILGCLQAHQGELSRACRAVVSGDVPKPNANAKGGAGKQPAPKGPPPLLGARALMDCRTDLTAFCRAAGQKRERLRNCLRNHRAELSEQCTRALDDELRRKKESEDRAEARARKRRAEAEAEGEVPPAAEAPSEPEPRSSGAANEAASGAVPQPAGDPRQASPPVEPAPKLSPRPSSPR